MSRLVAAFAASHSPMLTAELRDWEENFAPLDQRRDHLDLDGNPATFETLLAQAPADARERIAPAKLAQRHAGTRAALARLKGDIAAAKLDALIIVGDDQEEMFDDTNMPAFGIWYGESISNGRRPDIADPNWQQRAWARYLEPERDTVYPCDRALALHLITALGEAGFDPAVMRAMAAGQHEGHAFSFVHKLLMDPPAIPVVPVFVNTFYPPNQPTPGRCFALGQALRAALERDGADKRVGLFASGGLSHFLVDEPLDQEVIAAFRARDFAALRAIPLHKLRSGNSEIRNWICLAGALGELALDWIEYIPGYRSPALTGTGLCFAHWGA